MWFHFCFQKYVHVLCCKCHIQNSKYSKLILALGPFLTCSFTERFVVRPKEVRAGAPAFPTEQWTDYFKWVATRSAQTQTTQENIYQGFLSWRSSAFGEKQDLRTRSEWKTIRGKCLMQQSSCPFSISGNPLTSQNLSVCFSHYRALKQTGTEAKRFKLEE